MTRIIIIARINPTTIKKGLCGPTPKTIGNGPMKITPPQEDDDCEPCINISEMVKIKPMIMRTIPPKKIINPNLKKYLFALFSRTFHPKISKNDKIINTKAKIIVINTHLIFVPKIMGIGPIIIKPPPSTFILPFSLFTELKIAIINPKIAIPIPTSVKSWPREVISIIWY